MKFLKNILVAFFSLAVSACVGTEAGAGRVIDNASEVVKSGSEVLWIEPTPSPTPAKTRN